MTHFTSLDLDVMCVGHACFDLTFSSRTTRARMKKESRMH